MSGVRDRQQQKVTGRQKDIVCESETLSSQLLSVLVEINSHHREPLSSTEQLHDYSDAAE